MNDKHSMNSEIKPCPFCGYGAMFGVELACVWSISCQRYEPQRCGARIIIGMPGKFPRGVFDKDFEKCQENWAKWAYKKLLPRWNRRTASKRKTA